MKESEFIHAIGEVMWVVPSKPGKVFNAGIRFTKIDAQDRERLINYLFDEHYLVKNA